MNKSSFNTLPPRRLWEKFEEQHLSPYATLSSASRGREREEKPCEIRTIFQRDRDRIIHCKAFRRLKHKTQVFISPEGDHFRTRLTHTLEVSQIARTIARALRLNEDLTEAIAMGHDLGHTPFGHAGEFALDEVYFDGFRHNEQSLRVVDILEGKNGLNLSGEVRDGILKHSKVRESILKAGEEDKPIALEGQVVRIADSVAYINHDIDDSLRAGIISESDLPHSCLEVLGYTHSQRIDTMVKDIVRASWNKDTIEMSPEVLDETDKLREFLFQEVYTGATQIRKQREKAIHIVKELYNFFLDNPEKLRDRYKYKEEQGDIKRVICDFLAGMTDRYAMNTYMELFIPGY